MLSQDDRRQLLSLLEGLPEMRDEQRRYQLLTDAGLGNLADRIDLTGANAAAAREIVSALCGYGRESIVALLQEVRGRVGEGHKDFLDRLLAELQPPKTPVIKPPSGICPYKGLEYFDFNDEDPKYFFGREALTEQLLDRVRTNNFIALVGASGNGKSSVLRAGLLHQLNLGKIEGGKHWRIRIARPDRKPLRNLARSFVDPDAPDDVQARQLNNAEELLEKGANGLRCLVETDKAPKTVLVIDQFEEAFTRCEDLAERERFFACLMQALAETDDRLCLVIAMRADFVGKCFERVYSGLSVCLRQSIAVLPMEPDELKSAICKPAEQVGLVVEETLVADVLDDIAGAPGSLPLLQYTLMELWNRSEGKELTLAAYQALGGIEGTLDRRATEIYNGFSEAEQKTTRHIFQQLTQLGEGTEDTRRRVLLDNLIAEPQHPAERVHWVIGVLSAKENRLLATDRDEKGGAIIDVAHEALIRYWKLLRQWLEGNRDLLRQQRRIEASAVAWRERGEAKDYLLQGRLLSDALEFQKKQAETFPLSESAKAFVRCSVLQRKWNLAKAASWLIIPSLIVGEVVIREQSITNNRVLLNSGGPFQKLNVVLDLVKGCIEREENRWMPSYVAERLFGNCRSLLRAPLENAYLVRADLSGADLSKAYFSEANLSEADLVRANLSGADLSGAYLSAANLREADLREAKLINANLSYAYFSAASLIEADLSGADLREAKLINADLSGADLSEAKLMNTDLSGADLSEAYLLGVYLSFASLLGADLSGADLSYTNFLGADLFNANITSSILLSTDFRNAKNLMPEEFTREEPPFLCGVALPEHIINAGVDPNRDCHKIPQVLRDRYPRLSIERALEIVDRARLKKWD